jgi:ribose 5-phosphate isomerase RpiB
MPETSRKPRIALGSDHAGKETIRQFLDISGGPVNDPWTWPEESVDSPDYGKAVGKPAHVFLNTPFQGRWRITR